VFSEIVVVFSELDVRWPPKGLDKALRDMYELKDFRVAFCLETTSGEPNLHELTFEMERMIARGSYHFLPCPPLVFSRTETR
jgi:hypothetical protein